MQQPQFVQAAGPNALKIKISGSYKTVGTGEVIDFEDVEIIMPLVEEELAVAAARKRYAYSAIKNVVDKNGEKKYQKPIEHIRNVYIDDIEEIEYEFAYVGKGIKEMDEEDLQHLAVEKGIREIPLPRRQSGLGMREIRQKAYLLFAERVLGWKIDMNDPAQNDYAKWKDIIPNPLQKAAPVRQSTVEEDFGDKPNVDEKLAPQHVSQQPEPVSSAPHVSQSRAPKKKAAPAAPKAAPVVNDDMSELSRLQKLAKANGVEYSWDAEAGELRSKLQDAGISV